MVPGRKPLSPLQPPPKYRLAFYSLRKSRVPVAKMPFFHPTVFFPQLSSPFPLFSVEILILFSPAFFFFPPFSKMCFLLAFFPPSFLLCLQMKEIKLFYRKNKRESRKIEAVSSVFKHLFLFLLSLSMWRIFKQSSSPSRIKTASCYYTQP